MEPSTRCYLKVLSPLHLGCDEVYDPLSFVLDQNNQHLIIFDPVDFWDQLTSPDRQQFSAICREGTVESIQKLYKFIKDKGRGATGRQVKVCPGLVEHYRDTLGQSPREFKNKLNKFTIARTAFRAHDQHPYIPGSAIKGAWRTAYLNGLAPQAKMATPQGGKEHKSLEESLLGGSFDTDPLRLLKVSDFMPLGEVLTRIVYAINEKKTRSKFEARGPYQILEVIEPGAVFVGEITVLAPPPRARISKPLQVADLWAAANFYRREKAREDDDLTGIDLYFQDVPPPANGALLRLGRHSGAECVTIAGHRKIKIMQGRGQPPKTGEAATTLWLASDYSKPQPTSRRDLKPFGWVMAAELTADLSDRFREPEASRAPEPPTVVTPTPTDDAEIRTGPLTPPPAAPPVREVWERASLTWIPGNQTLTAAWQGKKATVQGSDLLTEPLRAKVVQKRKSVVNRITVEAVGNAWRIVLIG